MNEGARLDDIVHAVRAPAHLLDKPYLRPVYDEPEFVVRNLWRLYGGWYDGNPAAPEAAPRRGARARRSPPSPAARDRLAERASELAAAGDLRLAGHLAELAAQAAPDDPGVHQVRAEVFGAAGRRGARDDVEGRLRWAARAGEGGE